MAADTPVRVTEGDGPVILGQPHGGTWLPPAVTAGLNETGQALADTDWHIARLYDGLLPNATVVSATTHRYAIDANRDPGGTTLYPGRNTTGLCPLTDFDGRPLYRPGAEPDVAEIARRSTAFHAPYHAALAAQVERVRRRYGVALLYDCHSIRSDIPFLFDGTLPVLNLGTDGGTTCDPRIEAAAVDHASASGFDWVLNGRFRGGWTTRHYGRPADGVHTIQMEIAQRAYMDEAPPWPYQEGRAAKLRATLADLLAGLQAVVSRLAA